MKLIDSINELAAQVGRDIASVRNDLGSSAQKSVILVGVNSSDGIYDFVFENEGLTTPSSYSIDLFVEPYATRQASLIEKRGNGFKFQLLSRNTHYVDQPINCSQLEIDTQLVISYL